MKKNKKIILLIVGIILIVILSTSIATFATYNYMASEISYTKGDDTITVDNALNDLYTIKTTNASNIATLQSEMSTVNEKITNLENTDSTLQSQIQTANNKLTETGWITLRDGCIYKKKNGYVTLMLTGGTGITIAANTPTWSYCIGNLPAGYRPSTAIWDDISYGGYNAYSGCITVNTDGNIYLCGSNSGYYTTGSVTFPVD